MQPIPIPDGVAEAAGGRRVVIGDQDPTGNVRPCEYVLTESTNYPGRPCVSALIAPSEPERLAIAAGSEIWLTLDGAEVPWSLDVDDRSDTPVDWQDMFRRYAELVKAEEGITFLNRGHWSDAEKVAIARMLGVDEWWYAS
jgi:hypothetical protein